MQGKSTSKKYRFLMREFFQKNFEIILKLFFINTVKKILQSPPIVNSTIFDVEFIL
jgi:hypothetical protein